MANEPQEIHPYFAVSPDREHPMKDFRPRYEDANDAGDEQYGGLTVEQVEPEGSGESDPKGATVTESVDSSKKTGDFPQPQAPAKKEKPASADTGDSEVKQDKS